MSVGTTAPAAAQGNLGGYIERAPIPIYVWERNGGGFRLADLNRAARALSVAAEQDLLPALGEDLRRCADEQVEFTRELPGLVSGGHVRDLIATGVAIGPDRVLLHVLDVTAQRATEHRLRQSEERYRTLIQAANEGVWLVDEQGVSIFANQRVARLLGRSAEEILASRIADFVTERDRARVLAAVQTPSEVRQPFVATFQHRDGRALTCLVSVATVGSPDARPATLCVLSDMTALKREQDLRLETERRYQRIVETANEGVWVVDPSGMTTLVNDRMAEMLGTTRAEIEGRPFSEFAGDPTTVAAVGRSMEMDGSPLRVELSLVRADGSRIDVLVSLSALRDEHGELSGGLALISDVTALKRDHAELRESQERFSQVFEAAPVGIAFIAAGHLTRGRFLDVNSAFRDLVGRSDEELTGVEHSAVTHPADLEREQEVARRLFDGQDPTYEIEKRYVRPDGSHVWAQVRVALLRDERGSPLYLIAVAADISARKNAEAIAERAQRTTGTILEHSSDAVIEIHHDGTIAEFSPSAVRLFGYERDEAVGRELAELIVPPALRARQREALVRYVESGATRVLGERYSTTAMRADGSEFPAEVTIDVVADSDPPLFIGSVRSVAAEHALVAARQDADERFERSFRDSATGMALVGLDERFLDVNTALAEMLGRAPGDLIGRTWREILDPEDTAAAIAWQGRALAGAKEPLRSRQRIIDSEGRRIRVLLVASLVRRDGRVPIHYVHQYTPYAPLEMRHARNGTGEPLTYRERQVLTLLAKGMDGPAIAGELGLSPETVRSYTQGARAKLGAGTRTEAVALALTRGEIAI